MGKKHGGRRGHRGWGGGGHVLLHLLVLEREILGIECEHEIDYGEDGQHVAAARASAVSVKLGIIFDLRPPMNPLFENNNVVRTKWKLFCEGRATHRVARLMRRGQL